MPASPLGGSKRIIVDSGHQFVPESCCPKLPSGSLEMITIADLARPKRAVTRTQVASQSGAYDHADLKRWAGNDTELIRLSMKSSTAFDGEAKSREGDPSPM